MERTILTDLKQWKNRPNKKILILQGARQTGKTWLIREFGKQCYRHFLEINFERDPNHNQFFSQNSNPIDIMNYLQLSYPEITFDRNTLLFLDEIQACPLAITSLKFLQEQFPSDVIASGSLLGIGIRHTSSYPVGYTETMMLYPMSFYEFLKAINAPDSVFTLLDHPYDQFDIIPDYLHQYLTAQFKRYIMIGGMPEAVLTYCQTNSLNEVIKVSKRIVSDYYNDMAKYGEHSEKIKTRECYDSLPLQLAKDNKKFQYSVIKKGYNARYFGSSLKWLEEAHLIIKVNRLKTIMRPLKAYQEIEAFKVYSSDTGILVSQFSPADIQKMATDDIGIYKGALYENIAAIALERNHKEMYYYQPSSSSEIDFVIDFNNEITPVEIKARRGNASSFNRFMNKYQCPLGFKFSFKNVHYDTEKHIVYLPIYLLESVLDHEPKNILHF